MAEGRMIKRRISKSKKLALLKTNEARLLYTWTLAHLDAEGRIDADPVNLKCEVLPLISQGFSSENIQEYLEDMAGVGLIDLYTVDNSQYLQFKRFHDLNRIDKTRESRSHIPKPPENSGVLQRTPCKGNVSKVNVMEVKVKEVNGTPEQKSSLTREELLQAEKAQKIAQSKKSDHKDDFKGVNV